MIGSHSRARLLPGFGLAMGYTLSYLSLIVLLPIAVLLWHAASLEGTLFWQTVSAPQVMASYRVSFGIALAAAAVDLLFGLILAWILVRYSFWGKRVVDALIDLPFAMPTAISGIALATLYSKNGWMGQASSQLAVALGFIPPEEALQISFTPWGIWIALIFIGIPFVVRTVEPVLGELERELEEAAACLGARRWNTFRHVLLPALWPALLTGFALAFARAVGEYGSVIFIAGNIPYVSQITPLMIIGKLEEHNTAGATAIATVMLLLSLALLLAIQGLQGWVGRRKR